MGVPPLSHHEPVPLFSSTALCSLPAATNPPCQPVSPEPPSSPPAGGTKATEAPQHHSISAVAAVTYFQQRFNYSSESPAQLPLSSRSPPASRGQKDPPGMRVQHSDVSPGLSPALHPRSPRFPVLSPNPHVQRLLPAPPAWGLSHPPPASPSCLPRGSGW